MTEEKTKQAVMLSRNGATGRWIQAGTIIDGPVELIERLEKEGYCDSNDAAVAYAFDQDALVQKV